MAFMCVGLQTSENDQIIPFILLTWPLPKFALHDMTLWRAVCALLELDGFWRGDVKTDWIYQCIWFWLKRENDDQKWKGNVSSYLSESFWNSEKTLKYYHIWGHSRNDTENNMFPVHALSALVKYHTLSSLVETVWLY